MKPKVVVCPIGALRNCKHFSDKVECRHATPHIQHPYGCSREGYIKYLHKCPACLEVPDE